MSIIITHNAFLREALKWVLEHSFTTREICLIDLEGCSCLQNLMCELEKYELSSDAEFYFLGSRGIYSELLAKFDVISSHSSINDVLNQLSNKRGIGMTDLVEHVYACRTLKDLTKSQLRTCIMRRYKSNASIAQTLRVSTKTVDSTLYTAMQRLGLSSVTNLQRYISCEFSGFELDWLLLRHGVWF
ncbi:hypothetical protein V1599_13095 [Enterobacter sp. ECC-175]|uniref:helix-turn-helix transcriptional regulator n=1 Tax=Enterobacter sp. ECC-175 TaxID=3116479 RepID=UPI0037552ED0